MTTTAPPIEHHCQVSVSPVCSGVVIKGREDRKAGSHWGPKLSLSSLRNADHRPSFGFVHTFLVKHAMFIKGAMVGVSGMSDSLNIRVQSSALSLAWQACGTEKDHLLGVCEAHVQAPASQ